MNTKACIRCGKEKLLSEYYPQSVSRVDGTRGVMTECKVCRIQVNMENAKRHPARGRAASRRFRQRRRHENVLRAGGYGKVSSIPAGVAKRKAHDPSSPPLPDKSTLPGTLERVELYRKRFEAREELIHTEDSGSFDELVGSCGTGTSSYYG